MIAVRAARLACAPLPTDPAVDGVRMSLALGLAPRVIVRRAPEAHSTPTPARAPARAPVVERGIVSTDRPTADVEIARTEALRHARMLAGAPLAKVELAPVRSLACHARDLPQEKRSVDPTVALDRTAAGVTPYARPHAATGYAWRVDSDRIVPYWGQDLHARMERDAVSAARWAVDPFNPEGAPTWEAVAASAGLDALAALALSTERDSDGEIRVTDPDMFALARELDAQGREACQRAIVASVPHATGFASARTALLYASAALPLIGLSRPGLHLAAWGALIGAR